MSAPPEGLEPAEAYFRKLATPPPDAELRKLGRREHKKPSHSHLRLRLQGGGSAEQRDYVEEEVVQTFGSKKTTKEFKLIEDAGTLSRTTPFWICSECGNMLYPKEDKAARSLKRVCRHCHRESDADANLVFVNELHPTAKSVDAGSDMVKDPTLPHAKGVECPNCQHDEAVFFQAPMKGDAAMKLIFMCIKCAHRWLQ